MHEFDFQRTNQALLVGKNGSGKSTLLDALIFVLYGKAFRKIRLDQLINSINSSDLYVELEFEIGNTEYKICRGMKPDVFEIWVNGELKKQDAAKRDYQKFLENTILKMSVQTFKQIVILGSTSYIPFMRLDRPERRNIIEDLLDIQVFSLMNTIIKNRGYVLSREYKDVQQNLRLLNSQCDLTKEHIEKIEKQTKENYNKTKEKLKTVQSDIRELEEKITSILNDIDSLETDADGMSKAIDKLQEYKTLKTQIAGNLRLNKKSLKFFKTEQSCPTCEQDIDKDLKKNKIQHHSCQVTKFATGLDGITTVMTDLSQKINKLSSNLEKVKTFHNKIKLNRQKIENKNELVVEYETSLTTKDSAVDLGADKKKIVELDKKIKVETKQRNIMSEKGQYYSVILEMLKDSGIKTSIIKSYLPVINKLVRKYLDVLEFNVDFRFDENFNEIMKSRYRDNFSYANFSEGEKMRIDLALLFVWRELARMRNSAATNLLIMDEIGDSSLDADGFESFMKIIGESKHEQNVLIISHKVDIMTDKFNTIYQFEKKNNFSEVIM